MNTIGNGCPSELRQAVGSLRNGGVSIDKITDDISLAVTVGRLEASPRDRVEVTFPNIQMPANSRASKFKTKLQTLSLNAKELTTAGAIVGENHGKLTDEQRDGLSSFETLIAKGATFQIERSVYTGAFWSDKILHETLSVPNDKQGKAFLLVRLAPTDHFDHYIDGQGIGGSRIQLVANGRKYPLENIQQLNGIARNI